MQKGNLDPKLNEPKRIVTWWIKMADLNWPSHDGYDKIKRRAEDIAKANATTAMIFGTHFRWDFLPYFTLLHDYIGTVAEELHKCGVELYDHHSVNLVHRYDTREEMRHVMLHSGPHLPFSPSREAAASWEYKGKKLNDWRMVDVRTREPLYFPQYAGEGFCIANPQFKDAYRDYLSSLIRDTGIDGISADDTVNYLLYSSCGCVHCRDRLKKRAGIDLPKADDRSFWGNWNNPAWRDWIDLRFEAASEFFSHISSVFPKDFRVTTCGNNSASYAANGMATDARSFILGGCNYINLEMSGNMPPYKHDPLTSNVPISSRIINSSHHQAVARENGVRCFSTGFGFTRDTADIVWAVNKHIGADCWFSTLKDRLGLPEHILDTLPDEPEIIGRAFTYEKEHPELFSGSAIGQLGVYFSYETRKHTCFGDLSSGYFADYGATLRSLFVNGISPHTLFDFPDSADKYPIISVPSPALMREDEIKKMKNYLNRGGRVVMTGPVPKSLIENAWDVPMSPKIENPMDFFSYFKNGTHHCMPNWCMQNAMEDSGAIGRWLEPIPGLYYNERRMNEAEVAEGAIELCKKYCVPMPIKFIYSKGYLISFFESEGAINVHLLAEDFDTDIDHKLDEMRFHRSRVNYINKVEPIGISETVKIASVIDPEVYLPFTEKEAKIVRNGNEICLTLPQKTAYAILRFKTK